MCQAKHTTESFALFHIPLSRSLARFAYVLLQIVKTMSISIHMGIRTVLQSVGQTNTHTNTICTEHPLALDESQHSFRRAEQQKYDHPDVKLL